MVLSDFVRERSIQTLLEEFISIKYVFVPVNKKYKSNRGLSERLVRKRLERQGWNVWRGGIIGIESQETYPNVKKRYKELTTLLIKHKPKKLEFLRYICDLHHGMPDFLCFRNGKFKFVECKLGYESLSQRQKKCIQKLIDIGFKVEVHKLAAMQTKTRVASINLQTNEKRILEKQMVLKTSFA